MVDMPGIQKEHTELVLHPLVQLPIDSIQPAEIGLVDPFAMHAGVDCGGTAAVARIVAEMRADMASTMASRIASMTYDGMRRLRVAAVRANWLVMEQEIVQICVDLLWNWDLLTGRRVAGYLHGEHSLMASLERDGMAPVCEPLMQATDIGTLCDCALELAARSLSLIHEIVPGVTVESEAWFSWVYDTRHEPISRYDGSLYEQAAQRIADSLASIPVFQGLMVVGSFAETTKHDGLNDLDLYCYCSELPTRQMRADHFVRLGLEDPGSDIAFEYFQLGGVNVHLCLPSLDDQRRALDRLWNDGDESGCGEFSSPGFAASAYQLAHCRILRDPTGMLAHWKTLVAEHPPALGTAIRKRWSPVWARFAPRAQRALATGDRVHALIALRYCREAYLRILLADNGVYCDPNTLKWVTHEADYLPPPQREALRPGLTDARFDGIPTLSDQFVRLQALWSAVPEAGGRMQAW